MSSLVPIHLIGSQGNYLHESELNCKQRLHPAMFAMPCHARCHFFGLLFAAKIRKLSESGTANGQLRGAPEHRGWPTLLSMLFVNA